MIQLTCKLVDGGKWGLTILVSWLTPKFIESLSCFSALSRYLGAEEATLVDDA